VGRQRARHDDRDPNGSRIEKRSIQADGTMKNEVTFNSPDGKTETGWMVFNKTK
jgi:hypothetical protein